MEEVFQKELDDLKARVEAHCKENSVALTLKLPDGDGEMTCTQGLHWTVDDGWYSSSQDC